MLKRFFAWLFPKPPAQPERTRVQKAAEGFFSTDIALDTSLDKAVRLVELGKRSIPMTPTRVLRENVGQDGAITFAEDSDSFGDSLKAAFGLGQVGMPEILANWYGSQGFIGYQLCAILAQQWFIGKACLMPARDAVRRGYKFTSNDGTAIPPEILDAITRGNKRFKLNQNLVQFAYMNRMFGIRVALFKVDSDDADYYVKPFNADAIKPGTYRGISQIDPYWCVPELTSTSAMDPSAIDFYEPTYWIINGQRYHKSHLVIARGPEVADILKPSYLYGGVSIPQRIFERVYAAERTANEAPMLAMNKRNTVFYTDVAKAFQNMRAFTKKIGEWARFRDNWGIKVAQQGVDKVEQMDTSLADLDTVIMTQYQLACSTAGVPATKMMGTQPKGFNASGEYEADSYAEELETIQTNDMEPLVDRHMVCMIRSEVAPRFSVAPFNVECTWEPVMPLSAVDLANVNKTKADTAVALAGIGAVDGTDVRNVITADEHSDYAGIEALVNGDPNNAPQQ